MTLKESLLSYIKNSLLLCENTQVDTEKMSTNELLQFVDGIVDEGTNDSTSHLYEIVPINSYTAAKQYEHYAPTWCLFQSECVFYEETHQGTCHFIFCKRDDADKYDKFAFGLEYPYDNYGMSFIAVLLTEDNRVVSVTSRWNWHEDHYLNNEQLKEALGKELYAQTINDKPLTILHISDTHNRHRNLTNLPEADVIVHSGDFCNEGTEEEAFDFINWFCDLPYKYKIFIACNHDDCLYGSDLSGLDDNCNYLNNSSKEIEGLKFYGMPMSLEDSLDGKDKVDINSIPVDTDILITHQPPYGILDCSDRINYGDNDLLNRIKEVKPKIHLFGHIHSANGSLIEDGITYSNASCMDENYLKMKDKLHLININM